MVWGSYQISKRSVLVFRAAMDILDHVASSVDICRAEMDNIRHLNKFSRMDHVHKFACTDQNCKFARIQEVARKSKIARIFAHSQVECLNMFSRNQVVAHTSMFAHILLANWSMRIDRPIHCHLHHRQ